MVLPANPLGVSEIIDPPPTGAHRVGEAGLCLAESVAGGLEPSQGSEV